MNRTNEFLMNLFERIWNVSAMAAVTVVLILLLQRILHKRLKPRWHYLMWLLVIVRLLLPWGPESDFSIYNWISYPGSIPVIDPSTYWEAQTEANVSVSASVIFYRYCLYIWLLGIGVFGTYTLVINRRFALKITKETRPITDIRILQLFSQCKTLMSVHKSIDLVVSNELAAPTLFGFMKPRLVMPQAVLNSLQQEQMRHVFLHELAHCKRNDIGINWLMQILLILHWFNPVLWYASQRMREDQEIASDALALTYLDPDKSQDYGYTLIQLLENYVHPISVPGNANLSGSKSQLQRRIIMIKQFQSNSYRWSFVGLAAIIIISGCSLTDAKVNQVPAQSSISNTPIVEQKTTATVDSSPLIIETDKKPESDVVEAPKPIASNEPTIALTEQKQEPATIEGGSSPLSSNEAQPTTSIAAQKEKPRRAASVAPSVAPSEARQRPVAASAPDERPRPVASTSPSPDPSEARQRAAEVSVPQPAAVNNNVRQPKPTKTDNASEQRNTLPKPSTEK